jgi:hypothetical protein
MPENSHSNIAELIMILKISNSKKRRAAFDLWLQSHDLDVLDDRALAQQLEDIVLDAIIAGDETIEISTLFAQHLLVVLQDGVKKAKGGQPLTPTEELRKKTLVNMAIKRRDNLEEEGSSSTQARLQAAEEIAGEARMINGIKISAEYLAREMDKIPRH